MKKYILLSEKKWHKEMFATLLEKVTGEWHLIDKKEDFTLKHLDAINPHKIFIPHWSYIIPSEIYTKYDCVVFHMTDLPYGRGGSPLQNLIVRGHKETMLSAIKVSDGIDTGPVYLKKPLSLLGTAAEILRRGEPLAISMIESIVKEQLEAQPQTGKVVTFKRRKPEDGNISTLNEIEEVYDFIRMLDCEGYPNAFIETKSFRFEFSRASLKTDNSIIADVRIIKK